MFLKYEYLFNNNLILHLKIFLIYPELTFQLSIVESVFLTGTNFQNTVFDITSFSLTTELIKYKGTQPTRIYQNTKVVPRPDKNDLFVYKCIIGTDLQLFHLAKYFKQYILEFI